MEQLDLFWLVRQNLVKCCFPEIKLSTTVVAGMLLRAVFIIWQGVLIAKIIIEEYQNRTIALLFRYPIDRAKLIYAKIAVIFGSMFAFYILSSIFQHISIFLLSKQMSYITYHFENLAIQMMIILSTIFWGMIPLTVGIWRNSIIATIVTAIIITATVSNSQGQTAGLISLPIVAILLGLVGVSFTIITVKKMITSDLYN
ncbi:ABC transporter permease [Lysinibacillus pakistanensis]|uniref:Bacitracin ABC transporter permease n=1 Tax=Lysinibacillus pakistanensis TaxID=759811 RepID=A0ABX6DBL0_9BACI|nr:bacitracin ABC transporter permease [Lysinibacillus pakistanensis]